MTRKDFEVVAKAIARESRAAGVPEAKFAVKNVALAVAVVFQDDNPRFDREKFITACDVR